MIFQLQYGNCAFTLQVYILEYSDSLNKESTANNSGSLMLLFFNSALKGVKSSQVYLHVAGLGVADWYSQGKGSRDYPLGDVMWKLSTCRR
ncbi:MAG: hypothetical protein KME10_18485 [Plectolyngbya sp. WJT66-NPBG17]|jgi:hypothetical protein|nr:hypothetical protein [Plectolyngbya sp. WJT66-NPBG17]MBW4527586.1 hypothetical protein [Phormidium tanganyikae FI6-MK23]